MSPCWAGGRCCRCNLCPGSWLLLGVGCSDWGDVRPSPDGTGPADPVSPSVASRREDTGRQGAPNRSRPPPSVALTATGRLGARCRTAPRWSSAVAVKPGSVWQSVAVCSSSNFWFAISVANSDPPAVLSRRGAKRKFLDKSAFFLKSSFFLDRCQMNAIVKVKFLGARKAALHDR